MPNRVALENGDSSEDLKNNIEAIRISGGVDLSPNSELNKIVEKNLAELQEIMPSLAIIAMLSSTKRTL